MSDHIIQDAFVFIYELSSGHFRECNELNRLNVLMANRSCQKCQNQTGLTLLVKGQNQYSSVNREKHKYIESSYMKYEISLKCHELAEGTEGNTTD